MSDDNQAPQIAPSDMTASAGAPPDVASTPQMPAPQPAAPAAPAPSRLGQIMQAVAGTISNGLAGIPDKGRSSFITGLGEGTRTAKAAESQQQAIKFKTFDDSMRAANLHNQDLELQMRTQAQQDAHQKAQNAQREYDEEHGIEYSPHPNDGDAVTQTLQGQTAASGAASIAPGTHLSADGNTINTPSDSPETQKGLLTKYNNLKDVLGLPSLPAGASFVPPKYLDVMTHKMGGYDVAGNPIPKAQLDNLIPALQSQRDALQKNGASPYQLSTMDNLLGIYKANQKNHQDFEDKAFAKQTAQSAQREDALDKVKAKYKEEQDDNRAANKPAPKADTNMYVGTDKDGNQVAGTSDDLKTANAQGVTKLDSDTGKKVITARQLTSPQGLFSQIRQDMDALDAKGKLGSAATARLNDAMLQKAGADADYAPLFVHTHLLSTALMQAHVGSRGSSDMMEEFKKLADAGKMNAATLRSALGAEYKYVHEKAMLPKKAGQ